MVSAGEPLSVLLIEDNGADARIFEEMVHEAGDNLTIVWARSMQEARSKRDGVQAPFSLIVTDLGLPDTQGLETIGAVLDLFPNRPVVVMTGLNDSAMGITAVQRGCQDFVLKGFTDPFLLVRMLRYAIQRHETERQIKESEERFRTLVQMSPDAIIIATGQSITFVNPAAQALFGSPRRQNLEGLHPTELFLGPDSEQAVSTIISCLSAGQSHQDIELTLLSQSSSPLSVEMRVAPITVGGERRAQVILRDISLRKLREQELQLAQTVFETTAEAMMITDANKKIVAVNPAFTDITGYGRDQAMGQDPHILSSGRHDQAFYTEMWSTLAVNGHWRGEVWNRRADGAAYVQRVTISCIRNRQGQITNYVGVFSDITREKEASEKLRHTASHDALTGLPNRALLHDRLEQAISKASRDDSGLALLFIDLDGFKPINDTHGHLIGDLLLQGVAERLRDCVRESDTVARLGGDEFVILSLNTASQQDAAIIAQKVLDTLARPFALNGISAQVGASIGIALYPVHANSGEALLMAADHAMYAAKNAGRRCYRSAAALPQAKASAASC